MSSVALRIDRSGAIPDISERIGAATFVLSLRAKGVFDTGVLRALETVPRDLFAPRRFADLARTDVALPLACGQTMTAPSQVAIMLAALGVTRGHRVLEIGTGSGYVAALLARIGATIHSVERLSVLAETARARLSVAGFTHEVEVREADGLDGAALESRYDRIILNGAVRSVPASLTSGLVAGGRLVATIATEGPPRLVVATRDHDGKLTQSLGAAIRITPLGPGAIGPRSRRAATEA